MFYEHGREHGDSPTSTEGKHRSNQLLELVTKLNQAGDATTGDSGGRREAAPQATGARSRGVAEVLHERIAALWPSDAWNVVVEAGSGFPNWNADPKEQIHVHDAGNRLNILVFSRFCRIPDQNPQQVASRRRMAEAWAKLK